MAVGLGVLRLPPCEFWAMTPPEFVAAMEGYFWSIGYAPLAGLAPSREELAAMQQMFPDSHKASF